MKLATFIPSLLLLTDLHAAAYGAKSAHVTNGDVLILDNEESTLIPHEEIAPAALSIKQVALDAEGTLLAIIVGKELRIMQLSDRSVSRINNLPGLPCDIRFRDRRQALVVTTYEEHLRGTKSYLLYFAAPTPHIKPEIEAGVLPLPPPQGHTALPKHLQRKGRMISSSPLREKDVFEDGFLSFWDNAEHATLINLLRAQPDGRFLFPSKNQSRYAPARFFVRKHLSLPHIEQLFNTRAAIALQALFAKIEPIPRFAALFAVFEDGLDYIIPQGTELGENPEWQTQAEEELKIYKKGLALESRDGPYTLYLFFQQPLKKEAFLFVNGRAVLADFSAAVVIKKKSDQYFRLSYRGHEAEWHLITEEDFAFWEQQKLLEILPEQLEA